MLTHAVIVLGVMVAAFAITSYLKVSIELSMFLAAIAGAIAHGAGIPPRHIVDGAFTYFDVTLIFITATLFMNLLKEMGGVNHIVRLIVTHFHRSRFFLLFFLTLILLVPGAFTGSGSVTVLVVGALATKILSEMGITRERVTAIIFLCAVMSAAAPPINLWAMMAAAGANMPYVGFLAPLGILSLAGAFFSIYYLGWRGTPINVEKVLAEVPEEPGVTGWKVALPFMILIALIAASRLFPWKMPILGLPLTFMIAALATLLVSPKRLDVVRITIDTIEGLLPLIGVMIVVGVLVQIMALSGARGLISLAVVTLPLYVIIFGLFLILPFSEGLVQYASAPLLGVPLILLFNMKGIDPIIALAGMSVIWPLGDMLPPTTVVGRAAVMVTGFDGHYYKGFLKATLVPALFIALIGTCFVLFSKSLGFLTALG